MVIVAQCQSTGSLSQRPWVRLPAVALFFCALCCFKGLQTVPLTSNELVFVEVCMLASESAVLFVLLSPLTDLGMKDSELLLQYIDKFLEQLNISQVSADEGQHAHGGCIRWGRRGGYAGSGGR